MCHPRSGATPQRRGPAVGRGDRGSTPILPPATVACLSQKATSFRKVHETPVPPPCAGRRVRHPSSNALIDPLCIKSDHDDMNTALGIIPVLHHGCAPRWFCERIRAQRVNTLLVAVFFPPLFYFFPGLEDRVLSKCSDAHIYLDHGTCSLFQRWQSAFVSQIILGTYCNASSPEPWENVVNHGPRVNTSELSPSRPLCSLCPRASRPLSLRRLVCRHSAW